MRIFQYGSNLSSQRLNSQARLQGNARILGVACTRQPFRFTFPVWGGINNCAAAGILPGGSETVWGVVYDIPAQWVAHGGQPEARTLDEIEDEGRDYRRGPIELIWPDGQVIHDEVHTYHPKAARDDLITDWHYVRHILDGAREHALPMDYRRRLTSAIIENNPGLAEAINGYQQKEGGP
ncbi:gamma-glutamylcyclotransferase (GGCT)/AIG2-like uncharacterized protein YtfP [Natronospira proteinivora]|uniref:Gamma-glutamylcyclotransferase (GGCT)/AIG2-like uncharacterized protein YtfP n=1 Tax=Natronospira proteinivora TaxID=1807133 RepID=A0ABT1G6T6_9GAMM|nr:gamma-glutamylcyclotransferase family protein [Natronospira proteinivora]MCP1726063.1 gamma-glutamylcyclotransferase (GGCT)/AIG2-like uncharacterized protein YtfP [Natronospira proteinivora]